MHGYAWIVGYNGEFFELKGKPELETLVTGVSVTPFYSIAYVLAAKINFETFVNIRVMLTMIAVIFHLYLLNKVIKLNLKHLIPNLLSSTFICLGIFCCVRLYDAGGNKIFYVLAHKYYFTAGCFLWSALRVSNKSFLFICSKNLNIGLIWAKLRFFLKLLIYLISYFVLSNKIWSKIIVLFLNFQLFMIITSAVGS